MHNGSSFQRGDPLVGSPKNVAVWFVTHSLNRHTNWSVRNDRLLEGSRNENSHCVANSGWCHGDRIVITLACAPSAIVSDEDAAFHVRCLFKKCSQNRFLHLAVALRLINLLSSYALPHHRWSMMIASSRENQSSKAIGLSREISHLEIVACRIAQSVDGGQKDIRWNSSDS